MADIGERVASLETTVERLSHTLEGNGQPGLDQVTRQFISRWEGRESERDRRERRNNLILAAATVLLTALIAMTAYLTYRDSKRAEQMQQQSGQSRPQTAGGLERPHY